MSYLFDTSFVSHLLNPLRDKHDRANELIRKLDSDKFFLVSVITIAELNYGLELARKLKQNNLPTIENILIEASKYSRLEITKHTAKIYAELKSGIALNYMPNLLKSTRRKIHGWPEEWIDETTGKKLGIQENDLWLCSQAVERELTLVTVDGKIQRICDAIGERLKAIII